MQDHVDGHERVDGAVSLRARARARRRLRGHLLGQGARLRARRPDARAAAAAAGGAALRRRRATSSCSRTPTARPDAGDPLQARRGRRLGGDLHDRARAARALGARVDVVPVARRRPAAAAGGRAALRRRARARPRLARRLAAARAADPRRAGRARADVRPVGQRPRRAADAELRRRRSASFRPPACRGS